MTHGPTTCSRERRGLTLIELLISIAILAIVLGGLERIVSLATANRAAAGVDDDLTGQGRRAMERLVSFVQETDRIVQPATTSAVASLQVSERLLDTYNNATRVYAAAGDGLLDADNNSDRLVNNSLSTDPQEYVTCSLITTNPANGFLSEARPAYATASLTDSTGGVVICEHVARFACSRLATNLVEIELSLSNRQTTVTLRTRARTRWIW